MSDSIGHLHCRYRFVGQAQAAVAARLDDIARERIGEAWGRCLGRALGDDTAFYVLREVQGSLAITASEELTDSGLADRWAVGMANAVAREIANSDSDGENLVRFTDRAEFLASFIGDLLRGDAGRHWYYGEVDRLRHMTRADAIRGALLDEGEDIPSILGYLHRQGAIDRLIDALDEATLALIWGRDMSGTPDVDVESLAPLVHAATELVAKLDLFREGRPSDADIVAPRSASFLSPNWRDARSLAMTVFDVLTFLARSGYLRHVADADTAFPRRLDRALAALAWLDREWLAASVRSLIVEKKAHEAPIRPLTSGATPRQRELLADITAALPGVAAALDRRAPRSAANAIRIYAALISRSPAWANDPAAESMIAAVLAAWEAIDAAPVRAEAIAALAAGDLEVVIASLPRTAVARSVAALQRVSRLGAPAIGLLRSMPEAGSRPVAAEWVETRCAGILLLLRTVLDLRIQALASEAAYPAIGVMPPAEAIMIAVGARVGGAQATADGLLDDGLLAFAGLGAPITLGQLERACGSDELGDRTAFQVALFERLVGRRLVGGTPLHVHRVTRRDGQTALIGGDGHVYPFGTLDGVDGMASIGQWLRSWRARIDSDARVASDDRVLTSTLLDHGFEVIDLRRGGRSADGTTPSDLAQLMTAHRKGGERLTRALAALDGVAPGAAGFDLDMALTAIALIRAWAQWLPGFADSSVPYLLDGLLRRRGRIRRGSRGLVVELEPRALDVVLAMAGYLDNVTLSPPVTGSVVQFEPVRS